MSVNKVILLGNVGQDLEAKFSKSGTQIVNFSIATRKKWKSKDGGPQEKTEWHRCVAFGKPAEILCQHVRKGDCLYVEGELETRKWQDSNGQDRYTTEIRVTSFSFTGRGGSQSEESEASPVTSQPGSSSMDEFDDDIPF